MSEPHRLHPAAIVLMGMQIVRQFAIPALIPIALRLLNDGFDAVSLQTAVITIAILLALLGLSAAYGVLAWHRFTYRVEAGELRIEQGIVNRQRRFIPVERIQTFDSSQGLLQRLLGVVSVRVETAGGGGASPEVSLIGVSQGDSERLRQALATGRAGVAPPEPEEVAALAPPANVWKLSANDLLLAGSTGGRAGVALSIIVAAVSLGDELIPYDRLGGLAERVTGVVVVLGLALVVAAVTWLLGIAGTILAHAGFTITQQGDHLLIERGLLERRRATIPIERIQAIRIIEGVLRQPFGLVELRVESAGYGPKAGESTVLCPLLRRHQVAPFLERMAPSMAVEGTFQRLPTRARRRYALQLPVLIQPVLLIVPLIYFFYPLGLLSLLGLPALMLLGLWQYHDAGWTVVGDTLLLRWRAIGRTTAIVPRRRIQLGETNANPFQRRVNLATLSMRVPSGTGGASFGLMHMDHEVALRLLAWLAPRTSDAVNGRALAGSSDAPVIQRRPDGWVEYSAGSGSR